MRGATLGVHTIQTPTNPTNQAQPVTALQHTDVGGSDNLPCSVSGLLMELRRQGVHAWLRGNQICCRYEEAAMTDQLRRQIAANVPALIRALAPKPEPVCGIWSRWSNLRPRTLTLIRHNRFGKNRFGQDAATHPFALINLSAWHEADWNLADCHWFTGVVDAQSQTNLASYPLAA
jgi:hypothetical protein